MATETFDTSSAGRPTIDKDPAAVLDYSADFTAWLALVGDAISTYSVTVPTGLSVASTSRIGGVITAWISGGSALLGQIVPVVFHVVTTAAPTPRVDDRTIYLQIVER